MKSAESILEAVAKGREIALARAISHLESGDPIAHQLLDLIPMGSSESEIVGITGPPGTGKSTLVAELAKALRVSAPTKSLGIIAVDPSSPFSGGALLGDRLRMSGIADDSGVFIRSMAARGALGGLAAASQSASDLLSYAGYARQIIETVGVGQSEVDIASACDTTIVVLNPESGDSVQAIKAGLMEVADILVVNKADHPRAQKFANDVSSGLELRAHGEGAFWRPPVLLSVATEGQGVDEVITALANHRQYLIEHDQLDVRRRARVGARLQRLWVALNTQALVQANDLLESTAKRVLVGEISIIAAAQELSKASLRDLNR